MPEGTVYALYSPFKGFGRGSGQGIGSAFVRPLQHTCLLIRPLLPLGEHAKYRGVRRLLSLLLLRELTVVFEGFEQVWGVEGWSLMVFTFIRSLRL